jgi:hypothetical protein
MVAREELLFIGFFGAPFSPPMKLLAQNRFGQAFGSSLDIIRTGSTGECGKPTSAPERRRKTS